MFGHIATRQSDKKELKTESLTSTQKEAIEKTLRLYLNDIHEFARKFAFLTEEAITALEAILNNKELTEQEIEDFSDQMVLNSIRAVRNILNHPCPQNRADEKFYLKKENGFAIFQLNPDDCDNLLDKEATFKIRCKAALQERISGIHDIVFKNGRIIEAQNILRLEKYNVSAGLKFDVVAKEPVGLLSLTPLEDATTPPITKKAVVDYITVLVKQAITQLQKAMIKQIPLKLHSIYQPNASKILQLELLQAVVDDEYKTVESILKKTPIQFLSVQPDNKYTIKSKYTGQNIDLTNENALTITIKRKQTRMIEILFPYFKKLAEIDTLSRDQVSKAFTYQYTTPKKYNDHEQCKDNKEEIFIPHEYINYLKTLTDIITQENFSHSTNKDKLSDETRDALRQFQYIISPTHPVKLEDAIDPWQLLYAAFKLYEENFSTFQNDKQKNLFSVRIVGFIQSLLPPGTAAECCCRLGKEPFNKSWNQLVLLNDKFRFYRLSHDLKIGLGYEYYCSSEGMPGHIMSRSKWKNRWETLFLLKISEITQLFNDWQIQNIPPIKNKSFTSSSCSSSR